MLLVGMEKREFCACKVIFGNSCTSLFAVKTDDFSYNVFRVTIYL